MDLATKAMAEFIEEKGFQLSTISAATNIPYSVLWGSLSKTGTHSLRADEFLSVCKFIEKPAFDFYRPNGREQDAGKNQRDRPA